MRIVLAYSGGLDTSAAIPWLKERYGAEVVAVTMDLGQGRGGLEAVRDRALAIGAARAHVLDLRDAFAHDYVLPSLAADALYDDRSPMIAALSRPVIAKHLVEIADIEHADAVAHGGGAHTKKTTLDVLLRALAPKTKIVAPMLEWGMTRPEVISFARRHGIHVPSDSDDPCRVEANLWGRSIECADLDDAWKEPPDEIFTLTKSARDCPDEPAYVELTFAGGAPSAINGVTLPLLELITSLGTIAATHGVGRIDVVEHRVGQSRLREISEAPAAVLLHAAHRELRKVSASRDLERFSRTVSAEYADIIYGGHWFSPLRKALDGYVRAVQDRITGVVRIKLFKGAHAIVGRTAADAAATMRPTVIRLAKG
jgi:argininosuccinate synthase